MSATKVCTGCEKEFPVDCFHSKGSGKLRAECRQCRVARSLRDKRRHMVAYGKYRPWSALDDARLLALGALGLNFKEASRLLDRSEDVTRLRANKIPSDYPGIAPGFRREWKKNDPELIESVKRLNPILGPRETARRLGVSANVIAGIIHRHIRKGKPTLSGCGTAVSRGAPYSPARDQTGLGR